MQAGVIENLQAWTPALLVYPGVLFGVLLALFAEWLYPLIKNVAVRGARTHARQRSFSYPLSTFLKLAGRRRSAGWPTPEEAPSQVTPMLDGVLPTACALAPLLALVILPLPGSPLLAIRQTSDLLLVLGLLVIQPLATALLALKTGGQTSLRGAQELGQLLTGLLPSLVAVAALAEVSGSRSAMISSLLAAPETGAQTLVRLLVGGVLLVALPFLRGGLEHSANRAGTYAGWHLQGVALAAFWALLVLPQPGDITWAVILYTGATLFALIAMRLIAERLLAVRREPDRAALMWKTALPAALAALLVSLWWGGL